MSRIANTQQKVDTKKFGDNYDKIFRKRKSSKEEKEDVSEQDTNVRADNSTDE